MGSPGVCSLCKLRWVKPAHHPLHLLTNKSQQQIKQLSDNITLLNKAFLQHLSSLWGRWIITRYVLLLVVAIVCTTATCPSLSTHRPSRWLTSTDTSVLVSVPLYLCLYLQRNLNQCGLRSQDVLQLWISELDLKSLPVCCHLVLDWCTEGLVTVWFGNVGGVQVHFKRARV